MPQRLGAARVEQQRPRVHGLGLVEALEVGQATADPNEPLLVLGGLREPGLGLRELRLLALQGVGG